MDMTACGKCGNKCHLFVCEKFQMLVTDRMVNSHQIKQPPSRPTMWLRHQRNDVWRYAGFSASSNEKVPDNVLSGFALLEDCEYYVEKCVEEWNK